MGDHDNLTQPPFTDDDVRRIVDTAVNPFVVIDAAGTVVWAGRSVHDILGVHSADLVGSSLLDYVAPESIEHAVQSLAAASDYVREREDAAGWEGMGPVVQVLTPGGGRVTCSVAVATPVRTGLQGFVLQIRRSDGAHALESALIAMGQDRPLGDVMAHVAAMLEGELPAADVAVYRRYGGAKLDPVVGPTSLLPMLDAAAFEGTPWHAAFVEPGTVVEHRVDELPAPLRGIAAGHGYRWMGALVVPPTDDEVGPAALVIWSRHPFPVHVFTHERIHRAGSLAGLVIRWERGRQALQWAATHDVLTDLHNRSYFLDELRHLGITRATDPGPISAAVLYLDLDDFKPVNDAHGHLVGDHVLEEVARRLRQCVRPSDVVARLGGDEFAILCRGLDGVDAAERLAARLVDDVAQPMIVDGIELRVGLSVGMAPLHEGDDPIDLLGRADVALRTAKVDGKRRWRSAANVI